MVPRMKNLKIPKRLSEEQTRKWTKEKGRIDKKMDKGKRTNNEKRSKNDLQNMH